MLKLLDRYGLKANVPINASLAEKYPTLLQEITAAGHEVVAHGIDMDTLHYGGMDTETERKQITDCLQTLREMSGQPVSGWMSPAFSESFETPALAAAAGCTYICDWANDDLPYPLNTPNGALWAMPVSQEISDRRIIIECHQTEDSFVTQACDQFDALYAEAERFGPRVFSLTLTPYISGLPFRIKAVEKILKYTPGNIRFVTS